MFHELQYQTVRLFYNHFRLDVISLLEEYITSGMITLAELKDHFLGLLPEEERRGVNDVKTLVEALEKENVLGATRKSVELLKALAKVLELEELKIIVEKFEVDCFGGRIPVIHLKNFISAGVGFAGAILINMYRRNPERLENIQPLGDLGLQLLALYRGSVVFVLKVSSISSLKRLWQSYKDGSLKEKLKKAFNEMKELKEVSQGEEIDVEVTIDEEEYCEVLYNLILLEVKDKSAVKNTKRQRRHSVCCVQDVPEDSRQPMVVKGKSVKNTKRQRRHSVCCVRDVLEDSSEPVVGTQKPIRIERTVTKFQSRNKVMASTSWFEETDEKNNYTKLSRLLVDGGTQTVRSVFDGIHQPSSLQANLNANKTTLQALKTRRVLNNEQWYKLYPPSGSSPKSEDFDITLLFVLLRNICGLRRPATGWDVLPPVTDNSKEANLARIKYYRNNAIPHKSNTEINDDDFKQYWQDISSALMSLGLSKDDIDDLKSAPLGGKNYNQLLYDWFISDKDVKTQIEDVKSHLKSDIADVNDKLDDIRNVCFEAAHNIDHQIQQLAFSDFRPEINTKCKSFHPNTRQWILQQVKSHVDSDQPDSCIMLITAGPGMGKSTIAAKICQTYNDLGCLAGCHFFQFSNSTRNNPRLMLQSIARQMCDTVRGYREALERRLRSDLGKRISDMNCEELLTILLEEPLCKVEQADCNMVVVIDALDECLRDPKDELLKALREKMSCFPSWLRFVLTSRPSTNTSALDSTVAVEIKPEDRPNIKDLERFFNSELEALYPQYVSDDNANLVQKLVEMTEGLFLVAIFVIEYLKRGNVASPESVLEQFPHGISSVYEKYFSRLKETLLPYISEEERFYKVLEAVAATNNPLPKNMFYDILCLKSESEVPRQERKKRKDALNSLHWLFPIDGDHVTPLHKSVIDWLTLQGDDEHDFSVRVEDGNEVLASQCNDVLSDLRCGKKNVEKALNLTDSEKYALRFVVHLEENRSSVVKADKYGLISNIYFLAALVTEGIILNIPHLTKLSFILKMFSLSRHRFSYSFSRFTSFGQHLALFLQAAHAMGVSEETTPSPLDALNKYRFPYFAEKCLLRIKNPEKGFPVLLSCKDGFIAIFLMARSTTVYMFQLDGRYIRDKTFSGQRIITTSPNINFIVAATYHGTKIEILDTTTLEVVSQYEYPHDAIQTCHVFGDDQACFIVIKGRSDNKIYVIEALTEQVRNTITVTHDCTVVDVSCQGHIVVTRTWEREEPEEIDAFTNRDGEVELMFLISLLEYSCIYRELFLYQYDHAQEPIRINPLVSKELRYFDLSQSYPYADRAFRVSEDGRLLAYHYKDSIFIVNTSDGSVFKRCSFDVPMIPPLKILFVSGSHLVIINYSLMLVINVRTDEIEYNIYFPHDERPNTQQYLLIPKEGGKSFNLISSNEIDDFCEVTRLLFHNLNLQGLQ